MKILQKMCEEHISNNLVLSVVNKQRLSLLYAEPTKANP